MIERREEVNIYYHVIRNAESTYFVLQSIEIDASFPAYACVNHRKQCCRHIDKINTTLEC